MSIVIVAFEGAPEVSEEAMRKEAELDTRIEARVKGQLSTYLWNCHSMNQFVDLFLF